MKFITLLAIIISFISISSKKVSTDSKMAKGRVKAKAKALSHNKKGKNKKQINPIAEFSDMQGLNSYSYGYGTTDHTLADYVVRNML